MEGLEQLAGPLILAPLMLVVGLQLTPEDFHRVLAAPRAVIGGILGQLLLLPLMTVVLVSTLPVSPYVAAGALLVAATPGAGMSNVMAAVAKANVALSVSLTAFASLLSIITIPAAITLSNRLFPDASFNVDVPITTIVVQLIFFLALPIGLGMWLRIRNPKTALRYASGANRFAVVVIIVITAAGIYNTQANLPEGIEIGWAAVAAVAWSLCAMAIGYGIGIALRLSAEDRFTMLIEFGARNVALALIIAVATLGSLDLALFIFIYGITGSPIVLLLAIVRGRWNMGEKTNEHRVSNR